MKLGVQKRMAAQVLKCSDKRVVFDSSRLDEIKEAVTKADIRALVSDRAIISKPIRGISGFRRKALKTQKKKGRQKGHGSRKGSSKARAPTKQRWINSIRLQRTFLKELKQKKLISTETFNDLYRKAKGGFFRSKRHIQIFLKERKLVSQNK